MRTPELYRYYESCDEYGIPKVILQEYRVVKKTPKGFQIDVYAKKPRFVLDSGVKRFAHPTIDGAQEAFIKRKERHLNILKQNVTFIESVLAMPDMFKARRGLAMLSQPESKGS